MSVTNGVVPLLLKLLNVWTLKRIVTALIDRSSGARGGRLGALDGLGSLLLGGGLDSRSSHFVCRIQARGQEYSSQKMLVLGLKV